MDEGLFQLLFILFILAAAVFDAVFRSRAKRRRMEEMEKEEESETDGEVVGGVRGERRDVPPWESPEERKPWDPPRRVGRTDEGRGRTTVEAEGPGQAGEEPGTGGSADEMIPSDLWEEITGGSRTEPGSGTTVPDPISPAPSPTPAPSPEPGPSVGGPSFDRDAPGTTRWEAGQRGREERPREVPRSTVREEHRRPERGKPEAWAPSDERSLRRRAMAGEREEQRKRRRPGDRRPQPSPGRELIPRGDPDALRRAVIYREVLGPPLGFRPRGGGWEEEAVAFHAGGPAPHGPGAEGGGEEAGKKGERSGDEGG